MIRFLEISVYRKLAVRDVIDILSMLILSLIIFPSVYSQPDSTSVGRIDSSRVDITRLSIYGGVVVAGGFTVLIARYEPLWQEYYSPFRFHEDFTYAKNQDKLLHFYGGYLGSFLSAEGLMWAGFNTEDAVLYGSATSLAFLTFMKIEDGHISYLGFDRVDELANLLGTAYPVAQFYEPWLNGFTPKASYVASGNSVVLDDQKMPIFLEDHEGQKFWMGVTVHDLLPANLRNYWPSILGVAVGYTVRDLGGPAPYHETILALDLDLRKLPGDSEFLRTLWRVLNYIHLPMPAVRLGPSVVWHGLYF